MVYCLVYTTTWIIPDRPWQLEQKIKVENYLIREVLNLNIDEKKVEEAREAIAEDNHSHVSTIKSRDIGNQRRTASLTYS